MSYTWILQLCRAAFEIVVHSRTEFGAPLLSSLEGGSNVPRMTQWNGKSIFYAEVSFLLLH